MTLHVMAWEGSVCSRAGSWVAAVRVDGLRVAGGPGVPILPPYFPAAALSAAAGG